MTKLEVTEKQLHTIKASLLVALQVASRQQFGVADPPVLKDLQEVKELIRDAYETLGFLEGCGFQAEQSEMGNEFDDDPIC